MFGANGGALYHVRSRETSKAFAFAGGGESCDFMQKRPSDLKAWTIQGAIFVFAAAPLLLTSFDELRLVEKRGS